MLPSVWPSSGGGAGVSRPRYDWWSYVKAMIRRYPHAVTQRERCAVEKAITETRGLSAGAERMALVGMIFWRRSHTLSGAADACHVSERTARRWHTAFIRLVAQKFGLTE